MSLDPERARRARRWVWGCTGGCLGAMLLLGIVIYAVVIHFLQAMPVAPPQTFLTSNTSAFIFVRVDPAVPLTMETAVGVVMLPEVAGTISSQPGAPARLDRKTAAGDIAGLAPLQAVLALQPDQEKDALQGGLALSVRSGSRLLALLARHGLMPAATWSAFKGADIAQLDKNFFVALSANNFMVAQREDLLKAWAGNLEAERELQAQADGKGGRSSLPLNISPALRRPYDHLDGSLPVVFASLNSHHELATLAKLISDADARRIIEATGFASDNVLSLAGEIKPLSDRDGELALFIECADAGTARDMRIALTAAATELGDKWPLTKMSIEFKDDSSLEVVGEIKDLPAKVAALVAAAISQSQAAPAEPAPAEAAPPPAAPAPKPAPAQPQPAPAQPDAAPSRQV